MKEQRNTKTVLRKPQALSIKHEKIPLNNILKEEESLMKIKKLYHLVATFLLLFVASLATAQNKVVAYVPNWINLNTYVNQIDYAKLTHINIAFENPVNSSGDLSFNSQNNALITKAKANNVKILISIGGGAASTDGTIQGRYFSLINASNRFAFATKLVNYVVSHNLDGLDVDLEGPAINGDYGAFIAELSNQLRAKGKLCTSALSQGYGGDKVSSTTFQYFDFINIMAYDGRGPWDPNSPGNHSTLDFAKSNTQYWINRGLPRAKAVLGVPFYGYGFGSAYRNSDYSYSYIVNTYPGAENSDQAGSTIWYNGIPTIKAKTNYAFDQSIGGIMIWSLDYDVPGARSLLTAIDQVFKARTTITPIPQGPYNNVRVSLPGKIEVENYDVGGQDVAYNDLTIGNEGNVYRTDGVDIQATTDAGGGYNLGWLSDGEWLEYSVNVTSTGIYNIGFRTASAGGSVRLEVDGADVTGPVTLPNTGAYQTWVSTSKLNVNLTAGQHVVRMVVVTGGFNLNYVDVAAAAPVVQAPFNNTIISLPGKVEAENYDLGGQGLAYNDLEASNQGGVYRTDGVDIQTTTDVGAGYNVAYTADGEWLEYTVNVTSSGTYNVGFRTAGTGSGLVRLEVDGSDLTGPVTLPGTGAWQTWATTTKTNVAFTAGQHILRVFVVTGGFNLNNISVTVPVINNGPGYLHASGKNIVNNNGNYVIKAINLGNYMVQEGYMLNLGGGYQHNIKTKIADVVGVAARDKFYDDYYANFITKADIDSIAKWGFNSVRLPMHYNLFTPLGQQDVYIEKGFTLVDNILSWCKANNIYLILDLHAAPGGQSSGDISDYVAGQPSLWESQANRDQTVKLWRKFAERYANEEYIGGYDVINETNWTLANSNALLAQLMKSITSAIRQVDNNHIIFIEGNSYANDYTGLTPKWDNNMAYSFHKYWNDCSQGSLNFVLAIRDGQNVPIWLGEFGENSNNWIANAVSLMNANNIGWAIWPYKKMSSVSAVGSFKQPTNWSALSGYINGGAKPTQATGQAVLNELIENVKVQNCTFNKGYLRALFQQPGNNSTVPYTTLNLPGKVLAVNYDEGKQGYAYNDVAFQNTQYGTAAGSSTSWNTGWYYRNDGVDLQFSTGENGPTVGWTETNEWLHYTVNVSVAGSYTVKARVAGNGGNLTLSSDGATLLSNVAVAATGGWDTWQTLTLGNIKLTAGVHTLRLTFATAGFNLSYLDFSTQTVVRAPYGGTPALIPGKVEVENYDLGGQGSAYNDITPENQGGAYRTDGVDLQATTDTGAGFNLSYASAGEWLEYSVRVATAGNYDAQFRIATTTAVTKLHLEKAGQNISGSVDLPNTGAWQTWQTVTVKNIALVQGDQILRLVIDTDGINLNYVNFVPSIETSVNLLPAVSLTSPLNNSSFMAPASIVISAAASDEDGTISKVEFYNGSTLLGVSTTSPYTFNWSNVGADSYTITAKATDNIGAVTVSTAVTVKVNAIAVNKIPSVSLTSPVSNASFTAPAGITISANASDSDGTIAKVEFFNGSTLLASDNSSPYSYVWNNVAVGTYTITAKATDDSGAVATSTITTVKVNAVVTNPCSAIALYKENNGYVDGSKVQNAGSQYKCKPYPYSGWCNGAAWAYAPGTGAYWADAWTLVGTCSVSTPIAAKMSSESLVNNTPNPFMDNTNIEVVVQQADDISIRVYDKTGQVVGIVFEGYIDAGTYNYNYDASLLKADIYLVKYTTSTSSVTKKILKTE